MDKSLLPYLKMNMHVLQEVRKDLAFVKKRLSMAEDDVSYYTASVAREKERLCIGEAHTGELWLQLMNSGISHRHFLKIIQHIEDRT